MIKAEALSLADPGWVSASVCTEPVTTTWSFKLQPFEKPRLYFARGIVPVTVPHHRFLSHFSATRVEHHTLVIDKNFISCV